MSGRVLVVDDDPGIVDIVEFGLRAQGFTTDSVTTGEDALAHARRGEYDIVLLDVMLPDLSGTDVLREIRAESTVPVIMLTARDAELDRVLGLELGADDYVTKPFSLAEVASRIRAIMRRRRLDSRPTAEAVLELGSIRVDPLKHHVTVDGRTVPLTPSEFKVLTLLMSGPGRVYSRRQIMEHLSQTPFFGTERACDVHIFHLRRKIGHEALRVTPILAVRGTGYRIVPPAEAGGPARA